jgi:DNA-binding transcriptional LysR family regulator
MSTRSPISIDVLEIIDAIERRGSFAKAAEELNKATSAISYGVQKLEEQLDIALFQRQGRRSVLTPAGQLVLEEGRKILATAARLADTAKEVATGWETRIRIAVESIQPYPVFFEVLNQFLNDHPSIEIEVSECILNGGWEALEQDRVDLLVGVPGPVPKQRGYRAQSLGVPALVPVISARHKLAKLSGNAERLATALPQLRRVVTHDTSVNDIARSAGLSSGGQKLYVQTIDQKLEAILAGAGIGHLPIRRIQGHLDSGALLKLQLAESGNAEHFLAWKISNKGKGLQVLSRMLGKAAW